MPSCIGWSGKQTHQSLKIGLLAEGFTDWGGGIDFLRLVAACLRAAAPAAELHVLVPMCGPRTVLKRLRDAMNHFAGRSTASVWKPNLNHLELAFVGTGATLHLIDHGSRALNGMARSLHLDAMLPSLMPLSNSGTPWVGYIYDFQHKHLPQFFSRSERYKRNKAFRHMLMSANAVIVNSCDVVKDIEQFYPQRRARIFAMPFSPAPNIDAFSVTAEEACRRHAVSGPYFIICNQFWKHKDHATAFKAFGLIARQHPQLSLVCTGALDDYRFPGYFDQLMEQAHHDGVSNRILSLGLIPKPEQLALIRGAIALIQPTLFEGGPGGGAVYDGLAMGQRCLVSDIPVNLEIDDTLVTFFNAGCVNALADRLEATLALAPLSAKDQDPAVLIARGASRQRQCGQILLQALQYVVSPQPSSF